MSETLRNVQTLVREGRWRVSDHGYGELSSDGLLAAELLSGIESAIMVEDYPAYFKGPCVLALQKDTAGLPIHVLWGIPSGKIELEVLITAYRPDPGKWDATFLRRRS